MELGWRIFPFSGVVFILEFSPKGCIGMKWLERQCIGIGMKWGVGITVGGSKHKKLRGCEV